MARLPSTVAMQTGRLMKFFCNRYALFCFCMWSFVLLVYYAANDSAILTFGHTLSVISEQFNRNDIPVNSSGIINGSAGKFRQECIHPKLKVFNPVMMKHFKRYLPIQCQEEPDWVYVSDGKVRFAQSAIDKYKPFYCDYYPIERNGDYNVTIRTRYINISDGFPMPSDLFRVNCSGPKGHNYSGHHMGVASTKEREERPEAPMPFSMDNLSIAILGFDSMSRMSWLRRLTKTREYFSSKLGAIELEAHNIVGDGTTAVIFPMLTGKFEWELPECRRGFKGATTLDNFPFLWHKMKSLGYLTSWCNAAPLSAPFNWRMMGFSQQPTDFYSRPFYLSVQDLTKSAAKNCIGARTQSQIWLNYFKDIFRMYKNKRKFLFHFITEFSHDDNNLITLCEDDDDDMYTYFLDDPFVRTTLRGISVGRIGTKRKEYVSMHYVSCECEDDDDDMYTYFLDDPFVRTTLRGISVGRIGTKRKEYVSMHYVSCEMDDDIQNLLQFLFEGNYLNNTLLILMGDHGARYSFIRSTWQGKLEERLPYISFLFPAWFEKKYPEAIRNLRTNTKRLTTPFDMYETFQDILQYNESALGSVSKRGISLFKEIPLERSCDHAAIAPHWCACLAWQNVSLAENNTKHALQFVLDTINNYTSKYREECAMLFIANVTMATKLETRQEVLKFKQTDSNGGIYKVDLSAKNKNEMELYQLTFQTTPGGGHFEVTVSHDLIHDKFFVSDKEISRINQYGNDPACILEKNKQIRQYCYCNNNIS